MTTAAIDLSPANPLLEVLDDAFSPATLRAIAGEAANRVPWPIWRSALYAPLEDFLSRPGKAFRARIVEHGYRLGGGKGEFHRELPLLVELVHAGSLIVDDIEDGSDTRRGEPALHINHGMPRALNAGNWLYFLPFIVLRRIGLSADVELGVHRAMSRCLLSCHYGQALDLSVAMSHVGQADVPAVVETTTRLKTASLFSFSASLGALAAGASEVEVRIVGRFGRQLGMALQMLDDLGSLTSERRAHKGVEDLRGGRPTWPWAWLAETLDTESYQGLQRLARDVELGVADPEPLASQMSARIEERGRARIRGLLSGAVEDLETTFAGAPALLDVRRDVSRLEKSYG